MRQSVRRREVSPAPNPDNVSCMARVFHCDDSDLFRTVARVQLTSRGHEVVGDGDDGPSCLEGVAAADPDVLLLDHVLPTLVDLAALRARIPATAVILYAGMPIAELEAEAVIVGADAALSKASSFHELAELVREVAARGRPS